MIRSMTGYGCREMNIASLGVISAELRSSNHKFLETVLHLPEGFLSVEDKVKKEIESRLKRGRVTCVMSLNGKTSPDVSVNQKLLGRYLAAIQALTRKYKLPETVKVDTLINLPGVLALSENRVPAQKLWPFLKKLINQALDDLVAMRTKEGRALFAYLKTRVVDLEAGLQVIRSQFKNAIRRKTAEIKSDTERAIFLKDADITEEIERLEYHVKNFKHKLGSNSAIGKELDFIAQEMQREANTMGAKSCAAKVSGLVVQVKSEIEKLREQVQNIE